MVLHTCNIKSLDDERLRSILKSVEEEIDTLSDEDLGLREKDLEKRLQNLLKVQKVTPSQSPRRMPPKWQKFRAPIFVLVAAALALFMMNINSQTDADYVMVTKGGSNEAFCGFQFVQVNGDVSKDEELLLVDNESQYPDARRIALRSKLDRTDVHCSGFKYVHWAHKSGENWSSLGFNQELRDGRVSLPSSNKLNFKAGEELVVLVFATQKPIVESELHWSNTGPELARDERAWVETYILMVK